MSGVQHIIRHPIVVDLLDERGRVVDYPGYQPVLVTEWVYEHGALSPKDHIDFPTATGGAGTITGFVARSKRNGVTFNGEITPHIVIGNGVMPRLLTNTALTNVEELLA